MTIFRFGGGSAIDLKSPWARHNMGASLKEALGQEKETAYHIWRHPEKDYYLCFNAHRDDRWSEPVLGFPCKIDVADVNWLYEIILNRWGLPDEPIQNDPRSVPDKCKFDFNSLGQEIISKHAMLKGVNMDMFKARRTEYCVPYYTWPCQILQSLEYLRFGRASWLLR